MPRSSHAQSVTQAAFSLDVHGRVTVWSEAAEQATGYRVEEITGRHNACFYTPDEVSRGIPERDLQKAATDGSVAREGWRVRRDGSRFWAQTTIVAVRNPDGTLTGFAQEVREAAAYQLSRRVLDSLAEPICVLDRDGLIIFTNLAWTRAEMTHAMEMACGRTGVNYLDLCRGKTGPFLGHAAEGLERVLNGASRHFSFDYPCGQVQRRTSYRLTVHPLHRTIGGAIVVHADTTGTARLAERVWRIEKHYNLLIDTPFETAALLAPDGTVEYQSPAVRDVFGLQPEQIEGRQIFQFLHPRDAAAVREMIRTCMCHPHRTHRVEFRLRNQDGSWRIVDGLARKASGADLIALHSRDVTERKSAEASLQASHDVLASRCEDSRSVVARLLQRAEEERLQLARALSFDFGQQLASLSLEAAGISAGESAAEQLRALEESLASLGHDLRDVADGLDPAVADGSSLVAALRRLCASIGRKTRLEIEYSHAAIPSDVPASAASALYRVAEESLHNIAVHAAAKRASVSLRGDAKAVSLRIRDNSVGFDRPENARSPGLLTMRERLRLVNGTMRIRSRDCQGTEILVRIPVALSAARPD